jgi:hypothetical protein
LTGGTATFSDAIVGTGKTVTGTGFTLGGSAAGNYTLASGTLTTTANITAITVTGAFTAANKTYDATTAATILTRTVSGVLAADTANVTLSGGTATFSDKNVGTGKTVTGTGFSLTGSAAGNYTLASSTLTTTANITALTVTGAFTAANKTYDATTAATITNRSVTGVPAADAGNVSLSGGTATFSDANVGTGKTVTGTGFTLTGTASSNYTLAATTLTTTANISAKTLTVTGITASDKTFDGTTAATLVTTGAAITGVISPDVVTLVTTGAVGTFSNSGPGNGITVTVSGLTLAGAAAGNYALPTPQETTTANIIPVVTPPTLPGVIIGDHSGLEGTSGFTAFNFQVSLASAPLVPTTFDVFTTDGTALAGTHYVAVHPGDNLPHDIGTITFQPGQVKGTITVYVIAGASPAGGASKNFTVSVSNPFSPNVALASATGTIIPQSAAGPVAGAKAIIGDHTGLEGPTGAFTSFNFQVTLSAAPSAATTYDVFTTDGTAKAGTNYVGITAGVTAPHSSGTVTFAAGSPKATITVYVIGGSIPPTGSSETFTVSLANPATPTVALSSATGTIIPQNPQMALGTPTHAPGGVVLTSTPASTAQLNFIVAAAETHWAAAGVPTSAFKGVQFVVGNIATATNPILANTVGKTITIDAGAAGFGWFIDATNAAFQTHANSADLTAKVGTLAVGHMDLLTVVEHELGHIIGLADLTSGPDTLMSQGLAAGTRRNPEPTTIVSAVPAGSKLTQSIVNNLAQPISSPYLNVAGVPVTNNHVTTSTAALDAVFAALGKIKKV